MRDIAKVMMLATGLLLGAAAATAQSGMALDFDGDDYVMVNDSVDLRGPLTIEAWIRPDVMNGARILSNRGISGGYERN